MLETSVLNRERVDLLKTLVLAQRAAGPEYYEGFRGPTYGGICQIPLYHAGLPEDGLNVTGTDVYALREEGLVVISRTPERTLIRIDLTPEAFAYVDEIHPIVPGGGNGRSVQSRTT